MSVTVAELAPQLTDEAFTEAAMAQVLEVLEGLVEQASGSPNRLGIVIAVALAASLDMRDETTRLMEACRPDEAQAWQRSLRETVRLMRSSLQQPEEVPHGA